LSDQPGFLLRKLQLSQVWDKDVALLYAVFEIDFKQSLPEYRGKFIIHDSRKASDGREKGFWHLVTRGGFRDFSGTPDCDRAERLPWIRAIIEHPDAPGILNWEFREGTGELHTYLWLVEFDFVVVLGPLRKSDRGMQLITAFYVQSEMRRAELRRKYEARE